MAKAIDREMFTYFMQLDETEKKFVVELLKTFVKGRKINAEYTTIEQYNEEIDEAMERVGRGEFCTFEDLEKETKSW